MTELRWILLAVGLVIVAAIYVVGRRNRRMSASDPTQTLAKNFVPQLDRSIRSKARAVEPPLTASGDEMSDLPPMHAEAASVAADDSVHTPIATAYEPIFPESGGMSTGAFIAAQAQGQGQRSEPITRKLVESAPSMSPSMSPSESVKPVPIAAPPQRTVSPVTPQPAKQPASRKIVALRLVAGSERVEGARLKSLLEAAGLRHGKYRIYHRLHNDEVPLFSVASMVEPGTFDPYAMSGVQFPGVTLFMQLPGPIAGDQMLAQMLACARELEQGIGGLLQDERGLPLTEQRAQRLRDDVADFLHLLGQSPVVDQG